MTKSEEAGDLLKTTSLIFRKLVDPANQHKSMKDLKDEVWQEVSHDSMQRFNVWLESLTGKPQEMNEHVFEVAFTVHTREWDYLDLTEGDLMAAAQVRLDYLKAHPHEIKEACSHVDSTIGDES